MADEHFYEQCRELIDLTVESFDDGVFSWVEATLIGKAAYQAATHFADAMRGDDAHFAILLGEVNRAIDDAFLLLDKPNTDADFDIPWVPEAAEELGFALLKKVAKQAAEQKLTARRAKLIGG